MVESLNSVVDITVDGTSYLGMAEYGKIMIGNKGFEFYNDRNVNKFIQIPWEETDKVIVSIMFKGKWIPRFAIQTKRNGTYSFAAKQPKAVLRAIREYIGPNNIVKSLSLVDVLKRSVTGLVGHNS